MTVEMTVLIENTLHSSILITESVQTSLACVSYDWGKSLTLKLLGVDYTDDLSATQGRSL